MYGLVDTSLIDMGCLTAQLLWESADWRTTLVRQTASLAGKLVVLPSVSFSPGALHLLAQATWP